MSRYDELSADLAEMLADLATEVTWAGDDYPAAIAEPRVDFDLQSGGFVADTEFSVKIRRADLPEEGGPALKDTMTIGNRTFVVRGITDSPANPAIVYHVAKR